MIIMDLLLNLYKIIKVAKTNKKCHVTCYGAVYGRTGGHVRGLWIITNDEDVEKIG